MQVHLQPVRWIVGKGITLDQLFDRLAQLSPNHEEHEFKGKNRRLYVGKQDDYLIAMMLSSKDHKHTCEVEKTADGKLKLNVNRGDPHRPAVDFNFIALHHKTGRGLYMHYFHSTAFDRFSSFCRDAYEDLKKELIEAATASNQDDPKAAEKAKKKYSKSLKAEVLIRKEKVADLLSMFNDIARLDITAVQLAANEPWSSPDVEAAVGSVSHRFSFIRDIPIARQRAAANRLISALNARRGRIIGESVSDGLEKIVKLSRNVDSFGNYAFDEVAE